MEVVQRIYPDHSPGARNNSQTARMSLERTRLNPKKKERLVSMLQRENNRAYVDRKTNKSISLDPTLSNLKWESPILPKAGKPENNGSDPRNSNLSTASSKKSPVEIANFSNFQEGSGNGQGLVPAWDFLRSSSVNNSPNSRRPAVNEHFSASPRRLPSYKKTKEVDDAHLRNSLNFPTTDSPNKHQGLNTQARPCSSGFGSATTRQIRLVDPNLNTNKLLPGFSSSLNPNFSDSTRSASIGRSSNLSVRKNNGKRCINFKNISSYHDGFKNNSSLDWSLKRDEDNLKYYAQRSSLDPRTQAELQWASVVKQNSRDFVEEELESKILKRRKQAALRSDLRQLVNERQLKRSEEQKEQRKAAQIMKEKTSVWKAESMEEREKRVRMKENEKLRNLEMIRKKHESIEEQAELKKLIEKEEVFRLKREIEEERRYQLERKVKDQEWFRRMNGPLKDSGPYLTLRRKSHDIPGSDFPQSSTNFGRLFADTKDENHLKALERYRNLSKFVDKQCGQICEIEQSKQKRLDDSTQQASCARDRFQDWMDDHKSKVNDQRRKELLETLAWQVNQKRERTDQEKQENMRYARRVEEDVHSYKQAASLRHEEKKAFTKMVGEILKLQIDHKNFNNTTSSGISGRLNRSGFP